jgi:prefoldin subunit 5
MKEMNEMQEQLGQAQTECFRLSSQLSNLNAKAAEIEEWRTRVDELQREKGTAFSELQNAEVCSP